MPLARKRARAKPLFKYFTPQTIKDIANKRIGIRCLSDAAPALTPTHYASDDYVLKADGLIKYFDRYCAVDHVSLAVPRGMVYGVLGPNGAGKTTTIRMMLGIIDPDAGTRSLLGESQPRRAAYRVGYLPEERGLYPNMTAREAIAFMGAMRGLDWKEGRARAGELLESAGLGRVIDEKIKKTSKGMAQMIQLIGSIVHRPELIVLDEPFSGLDPVNQERLENLILAERDRGATIVFSTHVMAHAERMCDRLAIIARSKRRFEGTVEEARGTLPLQLRYTPVVEASEAAMRAILPRDARASGQGWIASVEQLEAPATVARIVAANLGIARLTVDRPGLHEAFVEIVRQADEEAKIGLQSPSLAAEEVQP